MLIENGLDADFVKSVLSLTGRLSGRVHRLNNKASKKLESGMGGPCTR